MLFAVVDYQDLEHVDHTALLVISGSLQGQLEGG